MQADWKIVLIVPPRWPLGETSQWSSVGTIQSRNMGYRLLKQYFSAIHSIHFQMIFRWAKSVQFTRWSNSWLSKMKQIPSPMRYYHNEYFVLIFKFCTKSLNVTYICFQTTSTNVTVTSFVSMTTFKMEPWEFLVPLNRFIFIFT